MLNLRRGDIARGVPVSAKLARVTGRELIEDVINDYRANGKRRVKDVERRWPLAAGFRRPGASSITTADINRFIAQRLRGDDSKAIASNGEINRELTVLKRAFSLAIKSAKLMAKPHIPMLRKENVRRGFLE